MKNELDEWVRVAVGPTLRERGFHGDPRRFRRQALGFVAGIQIQGSRGNALGIWRFTINYGVTHEVLAQMTGSEHLEAWHIAKRVGGTRSDLWWDVGVGSDRTTVARSVLAALTGEVLPFLDATSTAEGFRACVATYPRPWSDDLLRQLDQAEEYEPGADSRTLAERRLDHMRSDPYAEEFLLEHPEAAGFLHAAALGPAEATKWLEANPEALKAFTKTARRQP